MIDSTTFSPRMKGSAMEVSSSTAQSATSSGGPGALPTGLLAPGDDDVAIGCECANPALQIESWGREDCAQPLQEFY